MDERLNKIEAELKLITERNSRVEADKAWETSLFRVVAIAVVTYIVAVFVLFFIGADNYFLGALVPVVGFLLSVQSLPFVRGWWIKHYLKGRAVK